MDANVITKDISEEYCMHSLQITRITYTLKQLIVRIIATYSYRCAICDMFVTGKIQRETTYLITI